MAKIIPFVPVVPQNGASGPRTPEEVRKFMMGVDDSGDDLHINLTFIPLDDEHTAMVGDYDDIRSLIYELDGEIEEQERILDPKDKCRGRGFVLSVQQTMQLVEMLEDDGWEINPEVRRVAQLRCDNLVLGVVPKKV